MHVMLGWSSFWCRAEAGGTLTDLPRGLSSFSRSALGCSWASWAPSAPSGVLCMGKGQRKSCVRPVLPSASSASPGSSAKLARSSWVPPDCGAESSSGGEDGAGQALAGHSWAKLLHQLCPLKSCPQPWGHLSQAQEWCLPMVQLCLEPLPVM